MKIATISFLFIFNTIFANLWNIQNFQKQCEKKDLIDVINDIDQGFIEILNLFPYQQNSQNGLLQWYEFEKQKNDIQLNTLLYQNIEKNIDEMFLQIYSQIKNRENFDLSKLDEIIKQITNYFLQKYQNTDSLEKVNFKNNIFKETIVQKLIQNTLAVKMLQIQTNATQTKMILSSAKFENQVQKYEQYMQNYVQKTNSPLEFFKKNFYNIFDLIMKQQDQNNDKLFKKLFVLIKSFILIRKKQQNFEEFEQELENVLKYSYFLDQKFTYQGNKISQEIKNILIQYQLEQVIFMVEITLLRSQDQDLIVTEKYYELIKTNVQNMDLNNLTQEDNMILYDFLKYHKNEDLFFTENDIKNILPLFERYYQLENQEEFMKMVNKIFYQISSFDINVDKFQIQFSLLLQKYRITYQEYSFEQFDQYLEEQITSQNDNYLPMKLFVISLIAGNDYNTQISFDKIDQKTLNFYLTFSFFQKVIKQIYKQNFDQQTSLSKMVKKIEDKTINCQQLDFSKYQDEIFLNEFQDKEKNNLIFSQDEIDIDTLEVLYQLKIQQDLKADFKIKNDNDDIYILIKRYDQACYQKFLLNQTLKIQLMKILLFFLQVYSMTILSERKLAVKRFQFDTYVGYRDQIFKFLQDELKTIYKIDDLKNNMIIQEFNGEKNIQGFSKIEEKEQAFSKENAKANDFEGIAKDIKILIFDKLPENIDQIDDLEALSLLSIQILPLGKQKKENPDGGEVDQKKKAKYDIQFLFSTFFFDYKIKIPVQVLKNDNIDDYIKESVAFFAYQLSQHVHNNTEEFSQKIEQYIKNQFLNKETTTSETTTNTTLENNNENPIIEQQPIDQEVQNNLIPGEIELTEEEKQKKNLGDEELERKLLQEDGEYEFTKLEENQEKLQEILNLYPQIFNEKPVEEVMKEMKENFRIIYEFIPKQQIFSPIIFNILFEKEKITFTFYSYFLNVEKSLVNPTLNDLDIEIPVLLHDIKHKYINPIIFLQQQTELGAVQFYPFIELYKDLFNSTQGKEDGNIWKIESNLRSDVLSLSNVQLNLSVSKETSKFEEVCEMSNNSMFDQRILILQYLDKLMEIRRTVGDIDNMVQYNKIKDEDQKYEIDRDEDFGIDFQNPSMIELKNADEGKKIHFKVKSSIKFTKTYDEIEYQELKDKNVAFL